MVHVSAHGPRPTNSLLADSTIAPNIVRNAMWKALRSIDVEDVAFLSPLRVDLNYFKAINTQY